jgi:SpoVK/Ycf46/Vps4 family AAA+-type ATPase
MSRGRTHGSNSTPRSRATPLKNHFFIPMQTTLEGVLSPYAVHLDRILSRLHPDTGALFAKRSKLERGGVVLAGSLVAVVGTFCLARYLFSSPSSTPASDSDSASQASGPSGGGSGRGASGGDPHSRGTSTSSQEGSSHTSSSASLAALEKTLNKFEKQLLGDLVPRHALNTTFEDLGGLSVQIEAISRLAIRPLTHPHLYAHTEAGKGTSGVLLIGPPGTGKTMLAKAVAGSSKASFLVVNIATIQSKFFGETPKLVEAVFSLALKAAPCVVFVDEADGLLSTRSDMDQSHVNAMKAKFLECWDGLRGGGEGGGWVMVMGCTNKPWALDPAVQRRMPHTITVGLPGAEARADILRVLLRKERVSPLSVDYGECARATEGYSGSDLKALVRAAVNITIQEAYEREVRMGAGATPQTPRELTTEDLLDSLDAVKPTGVAASKYLKEQYKNTANAFRGDRGGGGQRPPSSLSSPIPQQQRREGGAPPPDSPYIPTASMRLNSAALANAGERR